MIFRLAFAALILFAAIAGVSMSAPAFRGTQLTGRLEVTSDAVTIHCDDHSRTLIFLDRADERKAGEFSDSRVRVNGREATARCKPYFVVESIAGERE